jgi:hypothetical protein
MGETHRVAVRLVGYCTDLVAAVGVELAKYKENEAVKQVAQGRTTFCTGKRHNLEHVLCSTPNITVRVRDAKKDSQRTSCPPNINIVQVLRNFNWYPL